MFGASNNVTSDTNVRLNDNNIEFVTHHKMLGFIVDNKLLFYATYRCFIWEN